MYQHVWGASKTDEPFGYLFGDLCEDRESQTRYVVITRAVASAFPLYENESEQISVEAARALDLQEDRHDGVLAGWYHRHRDGPARLSEDDQATYREHFGEPWQVAFLFITDPEHPAGGCFQPRTYGVTAHSPLPFYELARVASLMARGVRRTRIDWQNVETETQVLVEPLLRPEVPREAPEPAAVGDRSGAESVEEVVEEAASTPEPLIAEAETPVEEPVEPEPVTAEAETPVEEPAEPEPVIAAPVIAEAEIPAEEPVEPEPTAAYSTVSDSAEQVFEVEDQESWDHEAEPADEPNEEVEIEAPRPVSVVYHAPVSELNFELLSAPEHRSPVPADPVAALEPEPETVADPEPAVEAEPKVAAAVFSAASRRHRVNRERRRGLEAAVDCVVAAAAVAAIVFGAWPLRQGNSTTAQVDLTATVAGFIMPARAPTPALEESEASDPIALLGRDVRAAAGRYRTVAKMFAAGRLACAPLREMYAEVDEGWTAFSEEIARNPSERSEGLAYFDGLVTREVQDVEADFDVSGCDRP
jgi:proteasome lid subunit RPN8/RPN11